MVKLGSSGADRPAPLEDPASFGPLEISTGAANGKTWENLIGRAPLHSAAWLGDSSCVKFVDWLAKSKNWPPAGVAEFTEDFAHLEIADFVVCTDIVRDPDEMDEMIPFAESKFAGRILALFAQRGVHGDPVTALPLGGMIVDMEKQVAWIGAWGTTFGTRTHVWFEILKDEAGWESAYFYTNLLLGTRPIRVELVKELTETLVRGYWGQCLVYVGETPLASSLATFTRQISLGELDQSDWPSPVVTIEEDGLAAVVLGTQDNNVRVEFASFPNILRAGFVVRDIEGAALDKAVSHAVDSLVGMASVVEDGFRNARLVDSRYAFDQVFCSEFDMVEPPPSKQPGLARWIPESLMGELTTRSMAVYGQAYDESRPPAERREALEWVIQNGAGGAVLGAINTLVFSYLLPEREFEYAEALLQQAISMEVLHESTNALANLGALFIAQGRNAEAKETLLKALDRLDKFAEGEASVLLGELLEQEGDRAGAVAYLERAARSGDANFAERARTKLASLATSQEPVASEAKFCANCGEKRPVGARFCPSCGTAYK